MVSNLISEVTSLYTSNTFKFKKVYIRAKQKNIFKNQKSFFFGYFYGIFVTSFGLVQSHHIELIRRYLTRNTQKKGKILRKVFIKVPLTKKSSKSRMGKGVGKIFSWVSYINPGDLLFELQFSILQRRLSFSLSYLNKKLPFSCKIYSKHSRFLTSMERKKYTFSDLLSS